MSKITIFLAFLCSIPQQVFSAENEKQCLATAIYKEASTESIIGKRAVYDVIMNRVKASGKSVCAVIKSASQFSWYVDSKSILPYNNEMKKLLREVEEVGRVLMNKNYLYFFRKELRPKWARKMDCIVLESHKYCAVREA